MKKFLPHLIAFSFLFLMTVSAVHADNGTSQPTPPGSGTTQTTPGSVRLDNPFGGGDTLPELLKTIINSILLPIGGVVAVCAFIFSGFLFVTAQGNSTKIESAKRAFLYSVIGTAILLGAWTIANVIGNTIGELKNT